jgi:hypothetical protein
VAAEQRLAKDDFEATVQTGSIEVRFKPTNSIFLYARLVEIAEVVTFGPLSPGTIRHAGPTGDLGDYAALSDELFETARGIALHLAMQKPPEA